MLAAIPKILQYLAQFFIFLYKKLPDFFASIFSFFKKDGPLALFFLAFFKRLLSSSFALKAQYVAYGLLVAAHIAFVTALVELIMFVYNFFNSLLDDLLYLTGEGLLTTPFLVLKSLGVIDALNIAYASFSHIVVSLLILFVLKIAYKTFELSSNELFKIGVLLQLGLK